MAASLLQYSNQQLVDFFLKEIIEVFCIRYSYHFGNNLKAARKNLEGQNSIHML